MEIRVMMVGGRRCGKTSVIAAMKNCFQNVFGRTTNLEVSISDANTMKTIDDKNVEIARYFGSKTRKAVLDSGSTADTMEYSMNVSIKGKKGNIKLTFTDYPGEWFIKWTEHEKKLNEIMNSCDVIMIAIDTVYLMEKAVKPKGDSVGMYNEGRNYCSRIASMITEHFNVTGNDSPKLIMFVPLKCEKYMGRNEMALVNARIHTAYKEIFDHVSGDNEKNYEVVIAPILTFGKKTVRFSRFEYDENNEIIIDETTNIPSVSYYIWEDMNATYSPEYCEQPLLYTLAYLLNEIHKIKKAEKNNAGIFKKLKLNFQEKYGSLASANDFLAQKNTIMKHLKRDGDGYEIVNDPLHFR